MQYQVASSKREQSSLKVVSIISCQGADVLVVLQAQSNSHLQLHYKMKQTSVAYILFYSVSSSIHKT